MIGYFVGSLMIKFIFGYFRLIYGFPHYKVYLVRDLIDLFSNYEEIINQINVEVCGPEACNFIKKETLAQVFSCEFYKNFKNTFFHRTPPPVAVSAINSI